MRTGISPSSESYPPRGSACAATQNYWHASSGQHQKIQLPLFMFREIKRCPSFLRMQSIFTLPPKTTLLLFMHISFPFTSLQKFILSNSAYFVFPVVFFLTSECPEKPTFQKAVKMLLSPLFLLPFDLYLTSVSQNKNKKQFLV